MERRESEDQVEDRWRGEAPLWKMRLPDTVAVHGLVGEGAVGLGDIVMEELEVWNGNAAVVGIEDIWCATLLFG